LRAQKSKRVQQTVPTRISVCLADRAAVDSYANGEIVARFDSYTVGIGVFGADAAAWLQKLRAGVPLGALTPGAKKTNKESDLLVKRLANLRLLEFRVGNQRNGETLVVVEPQVRGYWPQIPQLRSNETLGLSHFAYMRRRGEDIVLESPRASALFKILDPQLAYFIATLSHPRRVDQLRKADGFPGLALLGLLVDCQIVQKTVAGGSEVRGHKDDHTLDLWEFQDLLFHTRSTGGRHAGPVGAAYSHVGAVAPLPAVRPAWPGPKIDLRKFSATAASPMSPLTKILGQRVSVRSFDNAHPITLAELSQFLGKTARVLSRSHGNPDFDDGGATHRPYPSAGASYELELYLAIDKCQGLAPGFYHYDASAEALVAIDASGDDLDLLFSEAKYAMGTEAPPQLLITIAARFGRVAWKYSSIAYALILKDAGVLTQTFYLAATEMRLGGCAIGIVNIDLFAKMTGLEFYVEGPVGQFALGRPSMAR
jgi:SagB-type dehydrogenase family enzyme